MTSAEFHENLPVLVEDTHRWTDRQTDDFISLPLIFKGKQTKHGSNTMLVGAVWKYLCLQ
jgi:hypothetical protein